MARKRVDAAEAAIKQQQKFIRKAENEGWTSRQSEIPSEEILNAIRDGWSDLASSNNEEDMDSEEDDEHTDLGKLTKVDKPSQVMGAISNTVPQGIMIFPHKKKRLHKLTKPGCGDAAGYFSEREYKVCNSRNKYSRSH